MSNSIKGFDKIMKKLSDPQKLASELIDEKGGIEVDCPSCHNKVLVPSTGATCSCGQEITLNFKK